MGDVGGVWRLLRGGEAVGAVEVDEVDFPWLRGMFVAEPGFEGVRPWFEEALAAIEGEEFERFEAVYDRIEGS